MDATTGHDAVVARTVEKKGDNLRVKDESLMSPGNRPPGWLQKGLAGNTSKLFSLSRRLPLGMEEIDPGSLAKVAYGLFEIYLNRELRLRGPYLFELFEQGTDLEADVRDIFGRFCDDYPDLADALLRQFGGIDAIYAPLKEGEGVLPSKTTRMYWIVQDAPASLDRGLDDDQVGKWLIFAPPEGVDETWRKIRDGTVSGTLGISAKVSTAKPNPDSRDERSVIYVYTRDWADEADVMRVRERLRELGFTERIGYKRNIETYRGEYSEEGRKVTYYSA